MVHWKWSNNTCATQFSGYARSALETCHLPLVRLVSAVFAYALSQSSMACQQMGHCIVFHIFFMLFKLIKPMCVCMCVCLCMWAVTRLEQVHTTSFEVSFTSQRNITSARSIPVLSRPPFTFDLTPISEFFVVGSINYAVNASQM